MQQIDSMEQYRADYKRSVEQPEAFWAEVAEDFMWGKKWDKVLDWNFTTPTIKWFAGGTCNMSINCLDAQLPLHGDKPAIIWEPNDPNEASKTLTYHQLHDEVCRFANVLEHLQVKAGDRVCLYLPMIVEAAVAMLACTRIGAIHQVVFAGFSATSLSDRINDSQCCLLITADAVYRGDKKIELKKIADEAMLLTPSIKQCVVYNHRKSPIEMKTGRDLWWHDLTGKVTNSHQAQEFEAETPLFILYTSGSTGKPKGVLHTTGGYMVYAGYTFKTVFNYQPDEVFFCTADIGWVTGHTYLVYGPLLNGATTVMFEGTPAYPDHGRFWDVIDKHKVNIFYTAPTAIRSLQGQGEEIFKTKNLSSLRVLGSVGEPINDEAWHWYHKNVGKEICPIVDTWWQTETGGILISPIATVTPLKPTFATLPLPGVQTVLLDDKANEIAGNGVEGNLCIKFPWPGMARSVYGDHERFKTNYFSTYPGYYFTGDGCKRDEDGYYRITGRVDDVLNVSGHRIGTGEIEDAINQHDYIIESAVVGYPHDVKGQGIYAFVTIVGHMDDLEHVRAVIKTTVAEKIGPFARPDKIQIVKHLPKTRSGKIMRRILRKIAEGQTDNLGDTTTLLDPTVVEAIKEGAL